MDRKTFDLLRETDRLMWLSLANYDRVVDGFVGFLVAIGDAKEIYAEAQRLRVAADELIGRSASNLSQGVRHSLMRRAA